MSQGTSGSDGMTKIQASARFNKLKSMTECIQNEDDFYAIYLGVARNLLGSYSVPTSTGTTPAVLPDAFEFSATMAEMLPAPSGVFKADYFSRPTYPIKVLYTIAEFDGFDEVEDAFTSQLALSNYDKAQRGIMNNPSESFFQRYGRQPRDVRKYNPRNRSSYSSRRFARHRKGNSSRSFDESRRRIEGFKCGSG